MVGVWQARTVAREGEWTTDIQGIIKLPTNYTGVTSQGGGSAHLSAGTSIGPKVSLSVLVAAYPRTKSAQAVTKLWYSACQVAS